MKKTLQPIVKKLKVLQGQSDIILKAEDYPVAHGKQSFRRKKKKTTTAFYNESEWDSPIATLIRENSKK